MNTKRIVKIGLRQVMSISILLFILSIQSKAQTTASSIPSDDEIKKVLIDRIDNQHESVGMVVGIITPQARKIISYGHLDQNDSRTLDGNTIFEIGSVTKIFTALLLADMIKNREVSLDDPITKFFPPGVKTPEKNGKQITLVDLATQTSGLPFWSAGIPANDTGAAMMANYSAKDLYEFLSNYKLQDEIGTKWAYSNLGFGLLGHILSLRAGKQYETLIQDRILNPLNMRSTFITIPSEKISNLSTGHDAKLNHAEYWNVKTLEGCGSLKSSAKDLLNFLGAFLGNSISPLDSAMTLMTQIRRPGNQFTQALGWWLTFEQDDDCVITHPGGTLGFSSIIAYDPRMHVGVVVLSNSVDGDVGGIAWHILRPNMWPWTTKTKERKEIFLDLKVLDKYAGKYLAAEGVTVNIEHNSSGLIIKTPTTPPEGLLLHAENDSVFFISGIDLQVSFQKDPEGNVNGLTIRFAGNDYPASRIKSSLNGEKTN